MKDEHAWLLSSQHYHIYIASDSSAARQHFSSPDFMLRSPYKTLLARLILLTSRLDLHVRMMRADSLCDDTAILKDKKLNIRCEPMSTIIIVCLFS